MENEFRKYEFTDETKTIKTDSREVVLHRIRATRDFGIVKAGDLGGWVEKEDNLAQFGDSWIDCAVQVFDNARVCENAAVYGDTRIYEQAMVMGRAVIEGYAIIHEKAVISGNARVFGFANIHGESGIYGDAEIYDDADISGNASICDNAHIFGYAKVYGDAKIAGAAYIGDYAEISKTEHYVVAGPMGPEHKFTTFFRNQKDKIETNLNNSRYIRNIDWLIENIESVCEGEQYIEPMLAAIEFAKTQIQLDKPTKQETEYLGALSF